MDLLGAYDSDSDEPATARDDDKTVPGKAVNVKETEKRKKQVVKFQIAAIDLAPLEEEEEDYRPRKRQLAEKKTTSLFDSLPKPQVELQDFETLRQEKTKEVKTSTVPKASRAEVEKDRGDVIRAGDGDAGRHIQQQQQQQACLEAAPSVSTNPNDMYRVGASGQYAYDYSAYYGGAQAEAQDSLKAKASYGAQDVLELALEEERSRRKRRGGSGGGGGPKVLEIDQSSLRGNRAEQEHQVSHQAHALGEDYEQEMRRQAGSGPSQSARRKHQIGSLYHDAKMAEIELLRNKPKALKTKRETQAKYGW